ncbi:hypothetical protein CDAR_403941 [Caerostris darwini]|uniref:Uncharacterized protein n=1 Tax=Caerostris darwini TaxID=1538125 RepID=A0AAV4STI1_9ARAC|nr:hypothetical protein CDAR_403941 [Caerostris darwini]
MRPLEFRFEYSDLLHNKKMDKMTKPQEYVTQVGLFFSNSGTRQFESITTWPYTTIKFLKAAEQPYRSMQVSLTFCKPNKRQNSKEPHRRQEIQVVVLSPNCSLEQRATLRAGEYDILST